jgi:hypothetical protein
MMRFSTFVVALALAALTAAAASSQERNPAAAQAADSERPMSIFNDKVRRFKFELEDTVVTAETAEEFMISYQGRNRPPIIGAYADGETNSLVVLCAPEAEEAVRLHLASRIIDQVGLGLSSSLKVKLRGLESRRRTLLAEMAELDVALVEADEGKAEQLQVRLAKFKDLLSVVERQIAIVNRYIERQQDPAVSSAQAGVVR